MNEDVVGRLASSKYKDGIDDRACAEDVWNIYAKKAGKDRLTQKDLETAQADLLYAQKKVAKDKFGEETGGVETMNGEEAKRSNDEKNKRLFVKRAIEGVDFHLENGENDDFIDSLFRKDKKNWAEGVKKEITKQEFVDNYGDLVKASLMRAAGNGYDEFDGQTDSVKAIES